MPELNELVNKQYELLTDIGLEADARRLQAVSARLKDNTFRVLITGEFSRGKSTLINALLGEELLATSLLRLPVINVVRGGQKRTAQAGQIDDLKDVAIDSITELEGVAQVELTWDATFLQDGLEIFEYPSMSEAPNSDAFCDMVEIADLIVVVVACDSLYSHVEADIIESVIYSAGHRRPLFVANFVDRIASNDLDDIKRAAAVRLPVNQDRIFFISAQNALDGDADAASGIASLKDKILEEAKTRKAIKTERVRQLLTGSLEAATVQIETSAKNASEHKSQTEAEINSVHEALRELQSIKSRIQRDLIEFRNGTSEVLQGKIRNFVRELALKVQEWGRVYQGSDLAGHLNNRLKDALITFTTQDFETYLRTRLKEQEDLLTNGFTRYRQQLNKLYNLLPENPPDIQFELGPMDVSPNLGDVNVAGSNKSANGAKGIFQLKNLIETPSAMLALVGTIAGSVLFSQFALILLPTGIGATAYLVSRAHRARSSDDELKAYAAQIRGQAGRLEVEVIRQINVEIDNLQNQVTQLLDSTTQAAQQVTQAKIANLQESIDTEAENAAQIRLEQIRAEFDAMD